MKIWITRKDAFEIQCGGIDRLQVWFRKPKYYQSFYRAEDLPFGGGEERGCREEGWRVIGGGMETSFSFGKAFGYLEDGNENKELVEFVWNKLKDHFGNTDFQEWHAFEKDGGCKQRDFLLEVDVNIIFGKCIAIN